jgi:hypothetical protein
MDAVRSSSMTGTVLVAIWLAPTSLGRHDTKVGSPDRFATSLTNPVPVGTVM